MFCRASDLPAVITLFCVLISAPALAEGTDAAERVLPLRAFDLAEDSEGSGLMPLDSTPEPSLPSGPSTLQIQLGFASLDVEDSDALVPPSPDLAVGPDHVVAAASVGLVIYDKTGSALTGPDELRHFFDGVNPLRPHTPNVIYDPQADRFIVAVEDTDDNDVYTRLLVAVSQTGDPTGSWWKYDFTLSAISGYEFFESSELAVGDDAIYVGANHWAAVTSMFLGARLHALEKSAMYAGLPAQIETKSLGETVFFPYPVRLRGSLQGDLPADSRHYFLVTSTLYFSEVELWEWDAPFSGANSLVKVVTYDVAAAVGATMRFPSLLGAAQPGPENLRVPTVGGFESRNGHGWGAMGVETSVDGNTVTGVVWFQLDLEDPDAGILDSGILRTADTYYVCPELSVNRCGDVAIGYTKTGEMINPSIAVTGRRSGDPPGILESDLQIKSGEIPYTSFDSAPYRWGYFTDMEVDPDGETFWYMGEYSKNVNAAANWGTWIASLRYEGCSAVPVPETAPSSGMELRLRPNPFVATANVRYVLPDEKYVELDVYSLRGRTVRRLVEGIRSAGLHTVSWDGRGDDGSRVASGTYILELRAGDDRMSRKVNFLR